MERSTKNKLIWTAAKLFQEKGFNGVGVSEILAISGIPKGSLYHHFPNGKSDLALAAATFVHGEMTRIIDDAFLDASNYRDGATTLFYKLAKLFELMGKHSACPVSHILFGEPDNAEFRERTSEVFDAWIAQLVAHAEMLGETPSAAQAAARHLFVVLQGGWTLARARQDSNELRRLPELMFEDRDLHLAAEE